MSFVPYLGYYLLRPVKEKSLEELKSGGLMGWYARIAKVSIDHRWKFFVGSCILAAGLLLKAGAPILAVAAGIALAALVTWYRHGPSGRLFRRP